MNGLILLILSILTLYHLENVSGQKIIKEQLPLARYAAAGTSVGPLAMFAGGIASDSLSSKEISIWNSTINRWTTQSLSLERAYLGATTVGSIAIFAGGAINSVGVSDVDIYDSKTNEWNTTNLSQGRYMLAAVSAYPYALFAGGRESDGPKGSSRIDIFNSETKVWSTKELAFARYDIAATARGPIALFACGQNFTDQFDYMDIFNATSFEMTGVVFPYQRYSMSATSVSPLAVFAGGITFDFVVSDRVDFYNYDTSEWTTGNISVPRYGMAATTVGQLAFFAGGGARDGAPTSVLDVYDYGRNQWFVLELSKKVNELTAISVGSLALFGGGKIESAVPISNVDIYQICEENTECIDDHLFCTEASCSTTGFCDYSLDPCRNNAECNTVCNEDSDNCFSPKGSVCGNDWCAGSLCDGIGGCSYSKPRCTYNESSSPSCQQCTSNLESCFLPLGEPCLVTGGSTGKCDVNGLCIENVESPSPSGISTGVIIGIVVGVVAGLLIVIGAIFFIMKRRSGNNDRGRNHGSVELTSSLSGIKVGHKLGGGNFGEVYKGTWNGTTDVALKKLKDQSQVKDFEQEANMLQSFQHPNIVRYLGVFRDSDDVLYIVTEYISDGSLLSVIHQHKKSFDTATLTSFAAQAAAGMAYLESKGIIHRDLSLRNLLASQRESKHKYQVLVSDFGLSRVAEGGYYRSSANQVPVKWTAPEALEYGFFTSKSDIWSFGVLLWELFSGGKQPYPTISNSEVLEKLNSGYRLPQPEGCPSEIYELMMNCWKAKAEERPTFKDIFQVLSNGEEMPVEISVGAVFSENFYA